MVAVGPIGIVGFYLRAQILQQAILEGCVRQNWCADSCSRTAIVGHRDTQGPLDVKITKPLSERDVFELALVLVRLDDVAGRVVKRESRRCMSRYDASHTRLHSAQADPRSPANFFAVPAKIFRRKG